MGKVINLYLYYSVVAKGCKMKAKTMAGAEGIEPSHTDPESAVLPLDDAPTDS
jgi:hypothetical protein